MNTGHLMGQIRPEYRLGQGVVTVQWSMVTNGYFILLYLFI